MNYIIEEISKDEARVILGITSLILGRDYEDVHQEASTSGLRLPLSTGNVLAKDSDSNWHLDVNPDSLNYIFEVIFLLSHQLMEQGYKNIDSAKLMINAFQNELAKGVKHYNKAGRELTTVLEIIETMQSEGGVLLEPPANHYLNARNN